MTTTASPPATASSPTRGVRRMPHLPALDGLRGLAVIGVLLFHGGFGWAKGGFLGVSVFFTLSGFLITNLLVREFDGSGTISLRQFWSRRFRRLMPAAIAGLFGVCLYAALVATPEQLQKMRWDLLAALGYVANWRFVLSGTSYGDLFTAPSPVQHFWSLAIEEQFYVVYPLLALVVLRLGGRRALTAVLAALAAGSLAISFALSSNLDRTYYGTDARAFELLAGALLAIWWSNPAREDRRAAHTRPSAALSVLGAGALIATFAAWAVTPQTTLRLARGGLALQAIATVVVIVAAVAPGPLRTLLALRPLRVVGLVSYGLYLYHWPVFLWLDAERVGWGRVPLFALRMAVTVALTVVSYYAIEQPIRTRRALHGHQVALALPTAVAALVAVIVGVTWNPPASTIAYANARIGDLKESVNVNTAPPPTSAGAVPAAASVLILGDSGMHDAEPGLTAALHAAGTTTVVDLSGPGFGFTLPEIKWRDIWRNAVTKYRPQLSIVMMGGWDYEYGTQQPDGYGRILDEAVGILTATGGKVLWLSMLPGGTTPERSIDAAYEKLPTRFPGTVAYTDIESALRAPDGTYPRSIADADGKQVLIRKPDKWHLCPEGAERLATTVLAALVAQGWSPAPAAGWQDGTWRSHERYDDPPGGCRSTT